MKRSGIGLFAAVLLIGLMFGPESQLAQTSSLNSHQQLALEIFQQLIEINTTDSVGDCTVAANAMAARLKAAGFADEDVKVLGPHPRKGNLVARLRGTGSRKRKNCSRWSGRTRLSKNRISPTTFP